MSDLLRPDFIFSFNKKRQWTKVFLWDVHPNTFERWDAGRWGYFQAEYFHPSVGLFGELHFVKSRLRIDTIYHELDHMRTEWIYANRLAWSTYTEEKFIKFMDQCMWSFLRELSKIEPKAKVWMKSIGDIHD